MFQNKLYASEVLSILCQSSEANQRRVGASEGIDKLLQLIAPWKKKVCFPDYFT
jgi:beta-catenin-like protein 1